MPKSLIYHGSNIVIQKPKILESQKTKDFGTGFYCTTIKEQAERWAKRFSKPVVNCYAFLPDSNLNIHEFKTLSESWLDFIVNSRNGKKHNFDIVIGAMANDQIYNYISDFIEGVITREQFWVMAKFKYPTHQICFCTEKSLECIAFESATEVAQ
jgi:hypothetical protein